tara:strand:+ start:180 stop:506 length:327 start_codon:yes stop_codon:yes gene_type:complete
VIDRKRIYISGPMSGIPDWNYPAFNAAEEALHQRGFFDVVNPARISPSTTPWEQCLRADIKALCDCDIIALLEGWEVSKGAHLEVHVAHRLGIEVLSINKLLDGTRPA